MCSLNLNGNFAFVIFIYITIFPSRISKYFHRKSSLEQVHLKGLISLLSTIGQFLYPVIQKDFDSRPVLSGSTWQSTPSEFFHWQPVSNVAFGLFACSRDCYHSRKFPQSNTLELLAPMCLPPTSSECQPLCPHPKRGEATLYA